MLDDRTLQRFSKTVAQCAERWRRTPERQKRRLGDLLDAMVASPNRISAAIGWLALAGLLTIIRSQENPHG